MLFTLLGEFVLPDEGAAWTSAVLAAFDRLGVAEKATRQALMRTSNAGWLTAEKVGRRTRWLLTPAATKLLTDGARRIYSFGPAQAWDGQWVLVAGAHPRGGPARQARRADAARLGRASARSAPACGSARTPPASRRRSGCSARPGWRRTRTCSSPGGPGCPTPGTMVAAAWDLPQIEAEYEQFVAEFRAPAVPSRRAAAPA